MQLPTAERLDPVPRRADAAARLCEWRLPAIETYPAAIAFAQSSVGKVLLFVVFGALTKVAGGDVWPAGIWLAMTVSAMVVSEAGRFRRHAALLSTVVFLAMVPFDFAAVYSTIRHERPVTFIHAGYLRAGAFIACAALAAGALVLSRRFRDHPIGRRPVLLQHVICLGLLWLATSHALRGLPQILLWSVIATYAAFFWFLAFALMEQRTRTPAPLLHQLASYYPFLGLRSVPWGRGADNWRTIDSMSEHELAVIQLSGLKLLVWACILKGLLWTFREIVYAKLGVTPLANAFEAFLKGADIPGPSGVFSIVANFPERLLEIAAWGHWVVAVARLAGFRLLRNTYRPLSSRTIAEFWNRYFYYFKEALVKVYFFPTYVRCFKSHPRLRLAFATFMAAGVGNFFFHILLDVRVVAEAGLIGTLVLFQTYAFYCLVLATGIIVSQLRARRPDPGAGWLRGHLVPSLGVAVFFCFLAFFDGTQKLVALKLHFRFLFNVFGVEQWIHAI